MELLCVLSHKCCPLGIIELVSVHSGSWVAILTVVADPLRCFTYCIVAFFPLQDPIAIDQSASGHCDLTILHTSISICESATC